VTTPSSSPARRAAAGRLIEVPHRTLTTAALRGLIEEFVTRSGTDYGDREASLDEKIGDVVRQLERGEVRIVYDAATQSANIVAR
jgi:uncharacterized protein YheU (UPF0270 family)